MPTWREKARPIIAKAVEDGNSIGLEGEMMRKFVLLFYPFGRRKNGPYAAWLREMKFQLNGIYTRTRREPLPGQMNLFGVTESRRPEPLPGQLDLFEAKGG